MPISNLLPQTSQPGVNHDVTLLSTGWIDKKQVVSIPGVSANEYDDWIIKTPRMMTAPYKSVLCITTGLFHIPKKACGAKGRL